MPHTIRHLNRSVSKGIYVLHCTVCGKRNSLARNVLALVHTQWLWDRLIESGGNTKVSQINRQIGSVGVVLVLYGRLNRTRRGGLRRLIGAFAYFFAKSKAGMCVNMNCGKRRRGVTGNNPSQAQVGLLSSSQAVCSALKHASFGGSPIARASL